MSYKVSNCVSWQVMDEILYIFDERNGEMYSLTGSSKEIFRSILKGKDIETIVDELSREYGLKKKIIEKDFKEFCSELSSIGLLERTE